MGVREESCFHHWMVGVPSQQESKGVCKNCGEEKWFKNAYEPDGKKWWNTLGRLQRDTFYR